MTLFTKRPSEFPLPAERQFGLFVTGVLLAVAVYGWSRGWLTAMLVPLILLGLAVGLIALLLPHRLAPINRAWARLGLLLGRVVSPVVLAILFFGLITPVALVTRLFGRDELHLRYRAAASYWIPRETARPAAESFTQQF